MTTSESQDASHKPRLTVVRSTEERYALFGLQRLTLWSKQRIERSFSYVPESKSAGGQKVSDAPRLEGDNSTLNTFI